MIGTIEELRLLVEDASRARPHLTSRLEKAAFLLLLRPVEKVGSDEWRVGSEDGLRFYTVRDDACECSDYVRHGRGHLCKHRIAVFLHLSLEGTGRKPARDQRRKSGGPGHDLESSFKAERASKGGQDRMTLQDPILQR